MFPKLGRSLLTLHMPEPLSTTRAATSSSMASLERDFNYFSTSQQSVSVDLIVGSKRQAMGKVSL